MTTRHAEIAGAGFAGLTAATALAQRGWSVRVHEKAPELRTEGAGIVLWNNSLQVLDAIGATHDLMSKSMTPPAYETRMNNVIRSQETLDGISWRTLTRPHLFATLLYAAREAGVEIVAGSTVRSATADGEVTLASGEKATADVVIGADGVGSAVRDSLAIPLERQRSRDGITRFLVPRRKEQLQALEPDTEWDNVIDFWNLEPRVLRVLYTPANDDELYIALMAPADDAAGSRVPIDLELWTSVFPQLAPVLEAAATVPGKYYGYQTTRVESWTRGRVALIGDAAHAMCPALAQGAGCAMQNAWTLAVAADETSDAAALPAALERWEQHERPFTDRCQDRSQHYADTREMANGNQFSGDVVETALYNPTDPRRHEVQHA
ncbi:FAD-dependent oxidoreductase [Microbacterium trichothecenolyticum]|uniref:2-methyl-3-hydroxypyridine 5-carboxylic acid dioxygenase n=1 Tax=Microbacterium trichothecenolyticum TaxID=69370 RepID=A0ABU0TXX7_MICTR|nr:NAD(P)/FAD-dependent oxidoreductase [Microbacterium trichothecenolyticum]MDQ1124493.1 2-methyl-3-hydroxypyridine 5-carboxylic acid dioxygenase [Microbacterium trichothecenolyticum]